MPVPEYKPARSFRPIFLIIAIVMLFFADMSAAWYFEGVSGPKIQNSDTNNKSIPTNCDIGGDTHFIYKSSLSDSYGIMMYTKSYSFRIYDKNGKLIHKYCTLHGFIYSMLHPLTDIESIYKDIRDKGWDKAFPDSTCFIILCIPLLFWLFIAIVLTAISRIPKRGFSKLLLLLFIVAVACFSILFYYSGSRISLNVEQSTGFTPGYSQMWNLDQQIKDQLKQQQQIQDYVNDMNRRKFPY